MKIAAAATQLPGPTAMVLVAAHSHRSGVPFARSRLPGIAEGEGRGSDHKPLILDVQIGNRR